jgi:hypothetical protein
MDRHASQAIHAEEDPISNLKTLQEDLRWPEHRRGGTIDLTGSGARTGRSRVDEHTDYNT